MSRRFAIGRGPGCMARLRRARRSKATEEPPGMDQSSRRSSTSPEAKKDPYRKWWGLHWRLVSLAYFALPVDRADTRAKLDEAIDVELDWIANPRRLDAPQRLREDGLYLSDASMEGNGLYVASRLGR